MRPACLRCGRPTALLCRPAQNASHRIIIAPPPLPSRAASSYAPPSRTSREHRREGLEGLTSQRLRGPATLRPESSGLSRDRRPVRRRTKGVASAERPQVAAWTEIGVPIQIVERLLSRHPHIEAPTPAQVAFLLSVFRGEDVLLKDLTGRGKTLAIVIAALSLAFRYSHNDGITSKQFRILILAPTYHLLNQINGDLLALDPTWPRRSALATGSTNQIDTPLTSVLNAASLDETGNVQLDTPIVLATPKDLHSVIDKVDAPDLKMIFIDEPDSMLPLLPSRQLRKDQLAKHRINKHPPPVASVLDSILQIRSLSATSEDERTDSSPLTDMSHRRDIQTVWTSATLPEDFKWFATRRGWLRSSELVDLNYGRGASERDGAPSAEPTTNDVRAVPPHQYVLTIHPASGAMTNLSSDPSDLDALEAELRSRAASGVLPSTMIENMVLLHLTAPPPDGTFALAVPPEGMSLDQLAHHIRSLDVHSEILMPETVRGLEALLAGDSPPILVARRSNIPGLHLQGLHTIYLLDGLDAKGLSGRSKGVSALQQRATFYQTVLGRLGRLGTPLFDQRERQRMITLVMEGGEEHGALQNLVFDEWEDDDVLEGRNKYLSKGRRKISVEAWDVQATARHIAAAQEGHP